MIGARSRLCACALFPLAALCGVGLAGCGYLFGDDGVFRDTVNDYRLARELPPMKLIEGRDDRRLNEIYAIPDITGEPSFDSGDAVPRPEPLVAASADQLVRIQKLGRDSWALIAIAPGQLWPQLRRFLSAANIDIARMDARGGIIESTYLELQNQTQPSRFRFRMERGVQRGNSELHVLQMYRRSADEWPSASDDLQLEADMLRGIAQYIANSADTAPVSMMAEQAMSATGKVALTEDEQGASYIVLELPFDRAWASLARSLDLSGFEVTDRNRSAGEYYTRYVGEDAEKKSGWFSWFGGGGDDHPALGVPLLITLQQVAGERMEIRLRAQQSFAALKRKDQLALLALIKGNID